MGNKRGELFDHFLRLIYTSIRRPDYEIVLHTFADSAERATVWTATPLSTNNVRSPVMYASYKLGRRAPT